MPEEIVRIYDKLREASRGDGNVEWVARMLASRAAGRGEMPRRLGLSAYEFGAMLNFYFTDVEFARFETGLPLESSREQERDELRSLFVSHVAEPTSQHLWLADMIVAGCMGGNHLWQDLGLWSRADVSALIRDNFPRLAEKNDRDMKWKRFLYKQLCIQEGIYTCRSPSCEVCDDYRVCFAPET